MDRKLRTKFYPIYFFQGQVHETNCMELSPILEATSSVATPQFLRILSKLNVHYRIYKSSPLVPILSQTNPVNSIPFSLSLRDQS
jgi:hypothetical protein